jgi:spermidine dehydrogenase
VKTHPLHITRRDFVNGALAGAGAALLAQPGRAAPAVMAAPPADWYGDGGVGDYASSHGNTPDVVATAHALRDGRYGDLARAPVEDTGERYDVVIVGAGLAGLGAAYEFTKVRKAGHTCLVLDNHPIFGGEAKRNEFRVDGVHLVAAQGSNGFSVPGVDAGAHAQGDARYYDELGVPREFNYAPWSSTRAPRKLGACNFGYLYWLEHTAEVGYWLGGANAPSVEPWRHDLQGLPWTAAERAEMQRWRTTTEVGYRGADFERWLDTVTYQEYLERHMGFGPLPARYASPILAGAAGLGSDVLSAYAAYAIGLPGMLGYFPESARDFSRYARHSFPGGNDGFARCFLKRILPQAIAGGASFEETLTGRFEFQACDRPGQPVRIRHYATAVAVAHAGDAASADHVEVTYVRAGKLHRLRARAVVMATGGWVNRYVVRDLPAAHREAYAAFLHAPFLVANVALRNWRFLYDAGVTAARYEGDFGHYFNVRHPMTVGSYQPPLDPDKPIVLAFYVPFTYPGGDARSQVARGRAELFTTSYARYEERILAQLQRLFGRAFDPARDVGGIILNRWGHAYVVPTPGFYFGRDGAPAAREIIQRRHGRIAFGHSELRGNQHWGPAAEEGRRALLQVYEIL